MGLDKIASGRSDPQSDLCAEPDRKDRRSRRRARITAQVHVRSMNLADAFDEVCKTVDVSRDGLLFVSRYKCYAKGQLLDVTFPYSNARGPCNDSQPAEVVRVIAQAHGKVAVAVHFLAAQQGAASAGEKKERRANSTPYFEGALSRESNTEQKPPVVLLLESNSREAEAIRNTLEREGYTLIVVTTGKEACAFLSENVPDVFIGEMETTDISVEDLCANINGDERLARVPMILTHSSKKPANHAESQRLGAVACIAKPLESSRLKQIVQLVAPPPASRGIYGGDLSDDLALK